MRIGMLILLVSLIHSAYAELVRIDFEVKDIDGKPIAGAVIRISTSKRLTLPYQKPEKKKFSCTTGKDGAATERFFCWDGCVNCYISADGYYPEKLTDRFFKTNYNRKTERTDFLEDYQKVSVTLSPIRNPIAMYAYRSDDKWWNLGGSPSCVGYDLMLCDWLPPRGNGAVADFYVHHQSIVTNGVRISQAKITFDEGGGAYIVAGDGLNARSLVYRAEENGQYRSSIESKVVRPVQDVKIKPSNGLIPQDGALVIRSRVKIDEKGNIVSSNYSKIYGPFSIAEVFLFGQICFNPNVNDTNLEFDTHKNLADKNIGTFYP